MSAVSQGGGVAQLRPVEAPLPKTVAVANNNLTTAADLVALLEQNGAMILASQVFHNVELVRLETGVIEFKPTADAQPKPAQDIGKKLTEITGQRWMASISAKQGQPTLAAQREIARNVELAEVKTNPLVKKIFDVFPDAEIVSITKKEN